MWNETCINAPHTSHWRQHIDMATHILEVEPVISELLELCNVTSFVGMLARNCIDAFCDFFSNLLQHKDELLKCHITCLVHRIDVEEEVLICFLWRHSSTIGDGNISWVSSSNVMEAIRIVVTVGDEMNQVCFSVRRIRVIDEDIP